MKKETGAKYFQQFNKENGVINQIFPHQYDQ